MRNIYMRFRDRVFNGIDHLNELRHKIAHARWKRFGSAETKKTVSRLMEQIKTTTSVSELEMYFRTAKKLRKDRKIPDAVWGELYDALYSNSVAKASGAEKLFRDIGLNIEEFPKKDK